METHTTPPRTVIKSVDGTVQDMSYCPKCQATLQAMDVLIAEGETSLLNLAEHNMVNHLNAAHGTGYYTYFQY